MKMNTMLPLRLCTLILAGTAAHSVFAWDYEGHRAVNQAALASLPADFPAFVKTPDAAERVAFLAGEPDRWRNSQDYNFQHVNEPDHYLDAEFLTAYGFNYTNTPAFRNEFVSALAVARSKNPDLEPKVNPDKNNKHTQEFFGFLPWAISENYSKLKSEFSYLKTFEANGGTPDEIKNAQDNIIYTMGVMGHYVGDSSQPLHATHHHHGWKGENPNGYTTNSSIHSWIDGGYLGKTKFNVTNDLLPRVQPAKVIEGANSSNLGIFQPTMFFIEGTEKLVEPLYKMEKEGKLSGNGTVGLEGRKFVDDQLLRGGQFLGDIWYTAYKTAPEDSFLRSQLKKRTAAAKPAEAPKAEAKPAEPAK